MANNDERTWETEEERQLKNAAVGTGKAVGKAVAKKVVSAIMSKIALGPVLIIGAVVLLFVIIFIIQTTIGFAFIGAIADSVVEIVQEKIVGPISTLLNLDDYDNEKRSAWNSSGDPDSTYLMYEKLKDNKEGTQTVDKSETSNTTDIMRTDTIFFSREDLLDLLEDTYEYNDKMFQVANRYYEYHQWSLEPSYVEDEYGNPTSVIDYYGWQESKPETSTTDDGMYSAELIAEEVRGEEVDGERIYSVHWQDIVAMMYFWGQGKYEEDNGWGSFDESEYIYNEGTEYEVNSSNGYYFSDDEISKLFNVFAYNFSYYHNAIEDGAEHRFESSPYEYDTLKTGGYNLGYRYSRIAEPEDLDAHYSDPSEYSGEQPTPTKFVPETAPNIAYNFTERYKYAYVSTTEVDGYTPDEEKFTPPEGIYCVGKWKVTDPRPLINQMSEYYKMFKKRSFNEAYVEQFNYNWVDDMMDLYLFYLRLLDSALGTDRCSYYDHIRDLYNEETIEVTYYGMKLSDEAMEEFIAALEEENPGMNIVVNYDINCREYGDFYEVTEDDAKSQASSGSIPFPSYGVTYVGGTYKNNVPDEWAASGNIPGEYNYTGTIFISCYGTKVVNDWIYLVDGADEPLNTGYSYTKDQIRTMLSYMNKIVNTDDYDFTNCTDDVFAYNQATGADIAGFLAIIMTENTPKIGNRTWNWFNFTAYGDEPYYKTSSSSKYNWWDAKTEFASTYSSLGYSTLEGCCMVKCMNKIYNNYWTKSTRLQNTYYRMTFNQYGWDLAGNTYFPQNWDEAVVQENIMDNVAGHCYCPWWDDTGYLTTDYNPAYLWCNKCAQNRSKLRSLAG